ncbi:formimidoylglutamase [Pedobacter rhizosphaerae]|uniref:Formiminoglutamase n=1 Tax=Pedobacter rhizosphaerae TaxID=390241 RepID=A0A1H9J071_9SPHI|nr:formimidoylglutamase [Pedobacter rhizosphaerae]SEQ80169.1 formiminoglutamase [Pedobacter rhizosphaerae]
MDSFKIYAQKDIDQLILRREGEVKLGEKVALCAVSENDSLPMALEKLTLSSAKFVLLGIPEDIGVRANGGIAGASSAWKTSLTAFLNIQSNRFLTGAEIMILGHFEINEPLADDLTELRNKVAQIDALVYPVIQKIVAAGKVPIVIGGGHNNSFPIIKGTSLALKKAIDVFNVDAHADLREQEGRHSGNGFTYALSGGYLDHYFMYGLHQNYNNEAILSRIDRDEHLHAAFFEDILAGSENENFWGAWKDRTTIGLEIDLDSIQNVLSSAETPSGFAANDIRKLIMTTENKFAYMHISEGATRMLDGRVSRLTSKLISYLISDFVKTQ